MLVAADIYRPAIEHCQETLGQKTTSSCFTRPDTNPVDLCIQGIQEAKSKGCNVVILIAGRLAMDEQSMQELIDIKTKTDPQNIFFVCDAMIGQSSVTTAAIGQETRVTGFIPKLDGDARGGAALSINQSQENPLSF